MRIYYNRLKRYYRRYPKRFDRDPDQCDTSQRELSGYQELPPATKNSRKGGPAKQSDCLPPVVDDYKDDLSRVETETVPDGADEGQEEVDAPQDKPPKPRRPPRCFTDYGVDLQTTNCF